MSLKKQFLKAKPVCKVTFRLSKNDANGAELAKLVGSFTSWEDEAIEMKALKTGDFTAIVSLPAGETFEYRFVTGEGVWLNDSEADSYANNGMGDSNSVVSTVA